MWQNDVVLYKHIVNVLLRSKSMPFYICVVRPAKNRVRKKGSWKRGLFRKVHFLEILENSRDSGEPPDCGKQRRIRPFARESSQFRDFRESKDSSSEKTPFAMTLFSGPERREHKKWKTITQAHIVMIALRMIVASMARSVCCYEAQKC